MTDENLTAVTDEVPEIQEPPQPTAPPIRSRFLFVDVAAQRAKQLRRGARPRVELVEGVQKIERLAMREVSGRYIEWALPPFKGAPEET